MVGPVVQYVISTAAFTTLNLGLELPPVRRAIGNWFRRVRRRHTDEESSEAATDKFIDKTINKMVNEAHNLINIPLALHVIMRPEMKQDRLFATCRSSRALSLVAAGFFTQDILSVCRNFHPEMFLHAGICCPIYLYSFFAKESQYYSSAFMLWEASTPFVHAREMMYRMGMGKTKAYAINGLAMMGTFFICRNVYGAYLLVDFWRVSRREILNPTQQGRKGLSRSTVWTIRTGGILMTALNSFWFGKMAQGAVKLFLRKQPV
mmetsp:Transcript_28041/g.70430  ORF Transcript_28041/g.70430 Transcript_28041/m.70430 type:complete len:263 (+) Transcript_28041:132-920(+)|eukprot:jgi/Tetstr1/458550/TSEL_044953.t1